MTMLDDACKYRLYLKYVVLEINIISIQTNKTLFCQCQKKIRELIDAHIHLNITKAVSTTVQNFLSVPLRGQHTFNLLNHKLVPPVLALEHFFIETYTLWNIT